MRTLHRSEVHGSLLCGVVRATRRDFLKIVDRKTGQVRYTDEYYLMKHLSHFVQPGSRLLKVSDGKNTLAFRSHDGKVVVVAYNPEEQERPCSFKVGSKYIRVILKGKSINTIVI